MILTNWLSKWFTKYSLLKDTEIYVTNNTMPIFYPHKFDIKQEDGLINQEITCLKCKRKFHPLMNLKKDCEYEYE